MSRLPVLLLRLRRLLLGAFYLSGLAYFWLPAHEVFEGPKTMGALLYACALSAAAWPLLWSRARGLWTDPWFKVAAALVAATSLSLLGAYALLPVNTLLALEHTAPVWASALAALVFVLEDKGGREKALFFALASHLLVLAYGLVQILDQGLGRRWGLVFDLIRWTSFGETRVYSSLGNPDYMAAQLTLFLPFLLYFHPSRLDLRRPGLAAGLAFLLLPYALLAGLYLGQPALAQAFLRASVLWALCGAALLVAARKASAQAFWSGAVLLTLALILVAQGRGAYLALLACAAAMLGLLWRGGGLPWLKQRWSLMRAPALTLTAVIVLWLGLLGLRAALPQAGLLKAAPVHSALQVTDSFFHRLQSLFDRSSGVQVVRLFYWRAAYELGRAHPLLGVGYGNHALFTAKAQKGVWDALAAAGSPAASLVEPHVELYTHNDFLQNFAETGLLGLAAFILFWIWLGLQAWRLAKDPPRRGFGLALGGFVAAFLANAMVNFPWRVLASQQWCWFVFALAWSRSRLPAPAQDQAVPAPSGKAVLAVLAAALFLALFPARWFFASSLFKQGNLRKDAGNAAAIPFYEKAVSAGLSGTQRVELYLYLGSMHNIAGRSDEAEKWFKRGTEIYPDFIEAWYNLGYTYQTRFNSSRLLADLDAAQKAFERTLEINPRYANALNNLGNIHFTRRDFAKAKEIYLRLLRHEPKLMEAHYNLGAVMLYLGDNGGAMREFEAALAIKPDYAPARQYLGQLRKLPKGAVLRLQ